VVKPLNILEEAVQAVVVNEVNLKKGFRVRIYQTIQPETLKDPEPLPFLWTRSSAG
jgi:hypothetical protein